MTDYDYINYSVNSGVATIALNTPKSLNAFHQKMRLELIDAVKQVETNDAVRVAILTGEGKSFSAGADLTEDTLGTSLFSDQCEAEYKPWLMGIRDSKKIYIAAVNGAAAGIGSAAVLNCDLVVMAEDAYLYQAFSAIGLMPDGGAVLLFLQKLGYQKAFEMAVDAGRLTAQECQKYGIANRVVATDELMSEAQSWAKKLAKGAPLSQSYTKQLMRAASQMSYSDVIDEEARLQNKLIQSEDFNVGVKAFFAKQQPEFKGK